MPQFLNSLSAPSFAGSTFVASGPSAAPGLVPSPGTTAGTTKFLREDGTWQVPSGGGGGGSSPSWHGNLYAAYGGCDPQNLLRMMQFAGVISPTQTNIGTSVARAAFFRPPANMVVNKIRFYGVGNTTGFRVAIYDADTRARLIPVQSITTTANTWGFVGNNLGLSLVADQLYFIAVSAVATGTVAGMLAMSTTTAATTGLIGVLPTSWPGNLDLDLGYMDGALAQFSVSTGVLPDPAPVLVAQTAWTGGFPAFFLDNNNA